MRALAWISAALVALASTSAVSQTASRLPPARGGPTTLDKLTIVQPDSTGPIGGMCATAPGGSVCRSLSDRAADALNVKDKGAKLDGSADTSAFQATRAAAPANGIVRVPPGCFNAAIAPDPAKTVLWQLSGNTYCGGSVPVYAIGTDIVETFLPGNGGKYISRGATTHRSLPMFTLRQDVSHSGGSGGVLAASQSITDHNLGSLTNAFVWNGLDIFYDHSVVIGGNNVARYSQYNREAAPAYAADPSDPGPHNTITATAVADEAIPFGAPVNTWAVNGVMVARKASSLYANSPLGSGVPYENRRYLTAQGFATSAATAQGQTITVARNGLIGGTPGLVAGVDYYLGDTPGTFTSTAPTPSQTDRFAQHVGTGVQATVNGATAVYLDIRLTGKTPGWSMVGEARDKTGRPSSQTGPLIGNETDVFANNNDDADIRYGVDAVVGRHNRAPGQFVEAAAAFRASSVYQGGVSETDVAWWKRGVLVDSGISIAAFDGSKAHYRGLPIAFRAGTGKMLDLSDDGTRTLRYDTGSLIYVGANGPLFTIGDNGAAQFFGKLTVPTVNIPDALAPANTNDPIGVVGDEIRSGQYMYRKTTSGWLRFAGSSF